jgi:bifunctional DNA-binding transcriptional regulator/antitoxin component of YhaV-PrlF toxin-antitoxin module
MQMPPSKRKERPGFAEKKSRYAEPRLGGIWHDQVARGERRLPDPLILPDGTVRHFLKLGPKGRVLLPADMRAAMGLEPGDVITAWLKDGELCLHSHLHGLRKLQTEARAMTAANVYASEELIAERRAENAKDEEETLLSQRLRRKKRR